MPYTKQDCLDKIQDISTNSQKCNKVVRALGVNVADDASLADLSTNIASIDTTFHPDYELPWIMADGSSGFILDIQTGKNRSAEFKGRLVPMYDTDDNYASNHGIVGTKWSGGACWGIDQMRYNTRMRHREDKSPGLSADSANNYVGVDNVWSETLNPWWVTTTWKCSHYDTNTYRACQYGPNSSTGSGWTVASSTLAQASTSGYNLTPIGLFDRFYVTSGTTWKMENLTGCAKKGTICESLKIGNGIYTELTWTDSVTVTPVLHWDCSTNKYRPCMRRAESSALYRYSSFPITAGLDYDDGADHMYYYELDKGITPLEYPTSTETYSKFFIETDIPYSTDYKYILKADAYSGSGNTMAIMITTGPVYAGISTYQQSIGSNAQYGIRVMDGGTSYQYSQFYTDPREYCFIAKIQFGSTLKWWQYHTATSYTSASKLFTYTSRTNTGTRRDGDRGNMSFMVGNTDNTTSPAYRFYWCYILDGNNNVIHYLVPVKHNNAYKLYDVITKKLYAAS